MRLLLSILLLWSLNATSQGLVRSILINADTTVVCTLSVRNYEHWDAPRDHYFKEGIATYLTPGDYVLRYTNDTTLLHSEWIHISTKWTTIYKYILLEHIPLDKVRFVRPKNRADWEEGVIYLEF